MKKYLIATLVCILVVCCTYYKLSNKLSPDIKKWYELHSPLMQGDVPNWIDANGRTERQHFLKMPRSIQEGYMALFWDMREIGAYDEFNARLYYVMTYLDYHGNNPWSSDRGRVFLLAGSPEIERYLRNGQETMTSMNESGDLLQWMYYQSGVGAVSYWFEFHPPNEWRLSINAGIRTLGYRESFERRCRERFYPTEDGWILYSEYLIGALEEK